MYYSSLFVIKLYIGDSMNCKYCGAALPTSGGVCPECGRMIPISQQKEMREMLDPRWNDYRNKQTAYYKTNQNTNNDAKLGKYILLVIAIIIIFIIIIMTRGN